MIILFTYLSVSLPYYQPPVGILQKNITYSYDKKLFYDSNYIILMSGQQISIFGLNNNGVKYVYNLSSILINYSIKQFDVVNKFDIYFLVQKKINSKITTSILIINIDISTNTMNSQFYLTLPSYTYLDIQVIQNSYIIVLQYQTLIIRIIDKLTKKFIFAYQIINFYGFSMHLKKIKTCKTTGTYFLIATWVNNCQYELIQCHNATYCTGVYVNVGYHCQNSDFYNNTFIDVEFGPDCITFAHQQKGKDITLVDAILYNWVTNITNIYYTVPSFKILGNNILFMALNVDNNKIVIFKNHNGSQVNNKPFITINFDQYFIDFHYNIAKNNIITFNSNGFYIYSLQCLNQQLTYAGGLCIQCPQNCTGCFFDLKCSTCKTGYFLNNQKACTDTYVILQKQPEMKPFQHRYNYLVQIQIKYFDDIIKSQTFQTATKIPGSNNILNKMFFFLTDLQNLWLYSYHQKKYGDSLELILQTARNIQDAKRSIFKGSFLQKISDLFNFTLLHQKIDTKNNYQSKKFKQYEKKGNSFLSNTLQFLIVNVPIIILILFIGRKLFFVTKLKLFKTFKYNMFFFILILDGNYQTFNYFFAADMQTLFNFSIKMKIINLITLILFYGFLFISFTLFFFIKLKYGQKSSVLFDNCNNNNKGIIFMLIQYGLKSLCLGNIHLFFVKQNNLQLIFLILIQGIFILILSSFVFSSQKLFQKKLSIWSSIFLSFDQIMLISTFFFQHDLQNQSNIQNILYDIQIFIILIKVIRWILFYLIAIYFLIFQFIRIIKEKVKLNKQQINYEQQQSNVKDKEYNKQKTNDYRFNYLKGFRKMKHNFGKLTFKFN